MKFSIREFIIGVRGGSFFIFIPMVKYHIKAFIEHRVSVMD